MLKSRIAADVESSAGVVDDVHRNMLLAGIARMDSVIDSLKNHLAEGLPYTALNVDPVEAFFDLVLAWMHLWCLMLARPKLSALTADAKGEALAEVIARCAEAAFYYGKVSPRILVGIEFPKYFGNWTAFPGAKPLISFPVCCVFLHIPCVTAQ